MWAGGLDLNIMTECIPCRVDHICSKCHSNHRRDWCRKQERHEGQKVGVIGMIVFPLLCYVYPSLLFLFYITLDEGIKACHIEAHLCYIKVVKHQT